MKEQKKIVITGGTSGLGRALAANFAKGGDKVVVVSRSANDLPSELRELGVVGVAGDLSDKFQITRIANEVLSHLESVDVLFNNASQLGPVPMRLLGDNTCEDFESVLATNLLGPFRFTKALLGALVLNGGGTVVNLSSDAAVNGYDTWGLYGVSKAALDQLSRVWNAEMSSVGVRFLALDPGDMDTPMHRAAIPDADFDSLYRPEGVAQELITFLEKPATENVRFSASEWRAL